MLELLAIVLVVIAILLFLFRKNKKVLKGFGITILIIISVIIIIAFYILLKQNWVMKIESVGLDCDCGTVYVYSNNVVEYNSSSELIYIPINSKKYKYKSNLSIKELYQYLKKSDKSDNKLGIGYLVTLKKDHKKVYLPSDDKIADFNDLIDKIYDEGIYK